MPILAKWDALNCARRRHAPTCWGRAMRRAARHLGTPANGKSEIGFACRFVVDRLLLQASKNRTYEELLIYVLKRRGLTEPTRRRFARISG
jgi:hypothetical protein